MGSQHSIRGVARAAGCLSAVACVAFAGCDLDEPWGFIGDDDVVRFSPHVITLEPAAPGSEAGATNTASRKTVTLFGTEIPREDSVENRPAEGAHVDVLFGTDCSGLADGSTDDVDYTQYVRLVAGAPGDADAACRQISDAQIHCVLGTNGTASFAVQASAFVYYGQSITLAACSARPGSRFAKGGADAYGGADARSNVVLVATAEVRVGRPLPADATLELSGPRELTAVPIACGNGKPPACSALRRSRRMEVRAISSDGSTLVGTPVDVVVTLVPNPKKANPPGAAAWLSSSEECPPNDENHLHRVLDPIAELYVCADGHEGDYELSVSANGAYASSTPGKATPDLAFLVRPQPALVTVTSGCSGQGAGGGRTDEGAEVRVLDCESQPIKGHSVAAGALATDEQGTTCVASTGEDVLLSTCNDNPIPVESEVAK